MTQQTERDEALIEHVRLNLKVGASFEEFAAEVLRLERSGWTPPTKPDRYVAITREVLAARYFLGDAGLAEDIANGECDNLDWFQAAAAVLRRHFERSAVICGLAGKFRTGEKA